MVCTVYTPVHALYNVTYFISAILAVFLVEFKTLRYLFNASGLCMQSMLVNVYRRFGTAFHSHFQGAFCLLGELKPQQHRRGCLKCRIIISSLLCFPRYEYYLLQLVFKDLRFILLSFNTMPRVSAFLL